MKNAKNFSIRTVKVLPSWGSSSGSGSPGDIRKVNYAKQPNHWVGFIIIIIIITTGWELWVDIVFHLISSINEITVGENWSKVAMALSSDIVMVIMILSTSVKGNVFGGAPGKVIPEY